MPTATPTCPPLAHRWSLKVAFIDTSRAKANAALAATKGAPSLDSPVASLCTDPLNDGFVTSYLLVHPLPYALPSDCGMRVADEADVETMDTACADVIAEEWHAFALTRDERYFKAAVAVYNFARSFADPVWQRFQHGPGGAQPFGALIFALASDGLANCPTLETLVCTDP